MIAIHTKFINPTYTRGTRVKAYTAGYGSIKGFEITIPYNHALDGVNVHFEAVKALVKKHNLDWNLEAMRYGDSADGKGFSFCFDHSKVIA
jgi:hypothetical protein